MKLLKTLRQTFQRLPRKALVLSIVAGALIAVPLIARAEFYPDRPTFDYNKPCNPNDNDPYDRCGSLTGPVFDSFINTPSAGDERAFLDARRTDQTAAGSYKNVLPDVTGGSQEVVVRMYVHNNANPSTNDGIGVAKNTQVRVALPTATGQALRARGYISASNATPQLIEDTVDFTSSQNFGVEYVPGSAKLYDNDNFKSGVTLSDSIVTTGAPIGSDALDGNFKGCFEFEAVVELHVKIKTPKVNFTKEVALPGQSAWGENVTTKPGDHVKWLISFVNNGSEDLTHVDISDKLPPHLQLVPGSVHYIDAVQDVVQNDAPLFTTGGIDFNTWKPNGGFYVKFETIAKDDFEGCQVDLRNVAYNDTDQTGKIQDTADVTIKKPNCVEEQPSFKCDALDVDKVNRTTFNFQAHGSAHLATITGYIFKVNGSNKQDSASDTFKFVETKPGTYTITAQVKTDHGTTGVTSACTKKVTVEKQPKTPVYSCDMLNKQFISGQTYRFTTDTTAEGGATVKQYHYDIVGNNNYHATALSNQAKGQYDHTFPGPGTFVVAVTVDFNVNGQVKSNTSNACKVTITIPEVCKVPGKEKFPPNAPECKPTTLINTGAGSGVTGLFLATTLAGAMLYRLRTLHKLNG